MEKTETQPWYSDEEEMIQVTDPTETKHTETVSNITLDTHLNTNDTNDLELSLLKEPDLDTILSQITDVNADTFLETRDISPQLEHSLLHETDIDSIKLETVLNTVNVTDTTPKQIQEVTDMETEERENPEPKQKTKKTKTTTEPSWADLLKETDVSSTSERNPDTSFETSLNKTQKIAPQPKHPSLHGTYFNEFEINTETISFTDTDTIMKQADSVLGSQDTTYNSVNPTILKQVEDLSPKHAAGATTAGTSTNGLDTTAKPFFLQSRNKTASHSRTEERIKRQLQRLENKPSKQVEEKLKILKEKLKEIPGPKPRPNVRTIASLIDRDFLNRLKAPYPPQGPEFIGTVGSWADRAHAFDAKTIPLTADITKLQETLIAILKTETDTSLETLKDFHNTMKRLSLRINIEVNQVVTNLKQNDQWRQRVVTDTTWRRYLDTDKMMCSIDIPTIILIDVQQQWNVKCTIITPFCDN